MTTIHAFNINGYVRVKLTEASLKLWRDNAERMRAVYPDCVRYFPLEPPLDEAGFFRGQFWSVMHLVAPEFVAVGRPFEDMCLHLEFEE